MLPQGLGTSIIIGVAEAGAEIATRSFQLVTGRNWRGTAFGVARGRTDVPRIVDWYMEGKLNIDVQRHPELTPLRHEELTPSLLKLAWGEGAGAGFCKSPLRRFSRSR
jgi:hypothetical protein